MKAQVKVTHGWYGCETGCCGHSIEIEAPPEVTDDKLPKHGWPAGTEKVYRSVDRFFFEHPYDVTPDAFAEHLVEEGIVNDATLRKLVEACGGYEIVSVEVSDD
jgi:hypothetical protein